MESRAALNRRSFLGGAVASLVGMVTPLLSAQRCWSDEDVPTTHWVYDAFHAALQLGFNPSIPAETGGPPSYSRGQLAAFAGSLLLDAERRAGEGVRPGQIKGASKVLRRLVEHFEPELQGSGELRLACDEVLRRLEALVRTGRPQGVKLPCVGEVAPPNGSAWDRGARLAQEEWRQGKAVLYLEHPVPQIALESRNAVHLRMVTDPVGLAATRSLIMGHNAAVWRHWSERGVPDACGTWWGAVTNPEAVWRAGRRDVRRLTRTYPGLAVRVTDGSWDLELLWERPGKLTRQRLLNRAPDGRLRAVDSLKEPARLVLVSGTRVETTLRLPYVPSLESGIELLLVESTALALIRVEEPRDLQLAHRLYAVDLRTGMVLNAKAIP